MYNVIIQDLLERGNISQDLPQRPYADDQDEKVKIQLLNLCILRAQKLKQRKFALVYAYYLGQCIEMKELSKKDIRKIISEYFYIIAVRTFYLFEFNPEQIFNTRKTTCNMIRKLKQEEFSRLIMEI